ncbi:MAG: chorismate mutase, partial [Actinomycetota bacterium]
RAIRGAIQLEQDERSHLLKATAELVTKVLHENQLETSDLISIWFTATPDLVSEFPALAARELGLGDVPLMCSVEMAVAGSMPKVIRLMMHVETKLMRSEIKHVYLRGAAALRSDLAQ